MKNSIAYYDWANLQWINFVYSHDWPEEYLPKLMNHIIKAERAWIEIIREIEWNRDLWQIESLEQLILLRKANQTQFSTILQGNLDRRVVVKRLNGQVYNPTIQDIILHILSHGDHHRGQMSRYVASKSLKAPNTDYIAFCIEHQL